MILIHKKKNLPCTLCKGKGKREALQIIRIKITPHVEHKGRVIIIKIKKSPHLCKMRARRGGSGRHGGSGRCGGGSRLVVVVDVVVAVDWWWW
jgi:hypothetical protein